MFKESRRSLDYIDSSWPNMGSKFFMNKKGKIRKKNDNASISLVFVVMFTDCKKKCLCLCSNTNFCSESSFIQRKNISVILPNSAHCSRAVLRHLSNSSLLSILRTTPIFDKHLTQTNHARLSVITKIKIKGFSLSSS